MEGDVTRDTDPETSSEPGSSTGFTEMLDDLVDRVRRTLGVDVASAAVIGAEGQFQMTAHAGAHTSGYRGLSIERGAGLGGLVLQLATPVRLRDYATSDQISAAYRAEVDAEGMHGMACVPVSGPDGIQLLLYAGNRSEDVLPDRALGRLEGLAEAAAAQLERLQSDEQEAARRVLESDLAARTATQQERTRIAAELHDSVAQVLFAIAVGAEGQHTSPEEIAASLAEIRELAATGKADLRRTFATLTDNPTGNSTGGWTGPAFDRTAPAPGASVAVDDLAARLTGVAEQVGTQAAVQVRLSCDGAAARADPGEAARLLLADGLREAIRNARRHGRANAATATLSRYDDQLVLAVQSPYLAQDDLPRLEPSPGSGVDLLRRRADLLGGHLELRLLTDDAGPPVVVLRLLVPALPASEVPGEGPDRR